MTVRMFRPLRLIRDQRGIALIEFAFVLPFLVLLFIGGYQLCDGVFAYRKMTKTARTVADLTSQYTAVSDSDLDTILNASQQVISPYNVANLQIVISQVTISAVGRCNGFVESGLEYSRLFSGRFFLCSGCK